MDEHHFDQWSRVLAASRNRRQLLVAVAGGIAGILSPFGRRGALADCPPGQCDNVCCALSCCFDVCVDLVNDPNNCGTCGNVCGAGEACCSGVCEFDLNFNWYNCGVCGNVCANNEFCCYGTCTDPQTDTYNCGSCGNACVGVPPPGQSSIGQCVNGQCEIVCEPGYYNCGQGCSDLLSDSANCGACWNACPEGQLCQNGSCVATCPPDLTDCGGVCVDTAWDPANCGGCSIGCASQAGWGLCCFGVCVDPQTDPNNCGGCEITCTGFGYLAPTCCAGTCVDVQTDPANCGGCGIQCGGGETCAGGSCVPGEAPTTTTTPTPTTTTTPPPAPAVDKWKPWTGKTQLRGAHVLQRRVDADHDDPALGEGPVGPAYAREDFARLVKLGANVVEIAHPVPLTLNPPYKPYTKLRANLDRLVDQAYQAGLFVVIGFRNGPGRSERALDAALVCRAGGCLAPGTTSGEPDLWTDEDAQGAWATAWEATAKRYRDHPAVVGYDLVVSPDAPRLQLWEGLARQLTEAVRRADRDTPVLVALPSNSADLLDFGPTGKKRTVYCLGLFPPDRYLLQAPGDPTALVYPGRFNPDRDGEEGRFDRAWVEDRTLTLEAFGRRHDVPVAVGAYGLVRWQPGATAYLSDVLSVVEAANLNHLLWLWSPEGWTGADAFDVERGTDHTVHEAVANDLSDAVRAIWKKNKVRPSGD